jgi:hypothetical protein
MLTLVLHKFKFWFPSIAADDPYEFDKLGLAA